MQTVAVFHDEAPTRPAEHVPSKMLVFASRAQQLVDQALDRLRTPPFDDETPSDVIADAARTLVELQALCSRVGR